MNRSTGKQSYRNRAFALVPWMAFLFLVGPALAQDEVAEASDASPFAAWTCRLCPEVEGWWGEALFGPGWVSDDSLRFGSYRGLEEKGAYLALDGDAHYRGERGAFIDIRTRDLGLDARELSASGGRQGRFELRFGWRELPLWRGYGAQTPFQGQGGSVLKLPADWQRARGTSGMSTLAGSLQPAPLGVKRETLDLGGSLRVGSSWSIDLDVQRQKKDGTKPFGGAGIYLNNATQLVAPVDFTTDTVKLGLNWGNRRAQLRFGFMGSWFDNGQRSIAWDNPFSGAAGTETLRSALEPSNEYYQFSVTGAYAISRRVNLSAHAAVGEMSQDEAFLPYSINPDFAGLPLPRASLDGRIDTGVFNAGAKLNARLTSRLTVTARLKWDERDNRTPVDVYTPVTSDVIFTGERTNRPYGFERTRYSADVRFRAHRLLRLSGGARRQDLDRTLQAVEQSEETTWWGEVTFTPFARSQLRLKLENGERDISEYRLLDDGVLSDHPLFRKYNQADRDREKVLLQASFAPLAGLGFNLTAYDAEDEYDNSALGLQGSDVRGVTISVDYALGQRITVYGFFSREDIESELLGRAEAQAWSADTRDRIGTTGAGLSTRIGERMRLGMDLAWSETRGYIETQTSAAEDPFPTLRTDLKNTRLYFNHEVSDQWGYRLFVEYEDFSSSDWGFDGLGVDGLDPVLTYGLVSPDYGIWNLRAQASYRF